MTTTTRRETYDILFQINIMNEVSRQNSQFLLLHTFLKLSDESYVIHELFTFKICWFHGTKE